MAHNITDTDATFSVRRPAWHGLSHVYDDYPTVEEARQLAHNWEPVTEPLFRRVPSITETGDLTEHYEEVESHKAIVRSDNSATLGVTGKDYEPVSNKTLYEIAEVVQGQGSEVRLETGGSLKGGKSVWLLLRLNEPLQIKGDPVGDTVAYFALQNSHDGSSSFRGQACNTRIVCQNTSYAADLEAARRGTEVVFRHTANVHDRIEEAKEALAGWREDVQRWRLAQEHLLSVRVTDQQRELFITEFIPMPTRGIVSERVRTNVETAQGELRGILNSVTCQDTKHTAYGLVQASIEYQQWVRRVNGADNRDRAESRFRRSYMGRDKIIVDAADLAVAVSTS